MNAIDLFAGAGGFSTGATMAGCKVVWAANHWQDAVNTHALNHPGAQHVCQDLHQARWEQVPAHDIMLASPCCQGHSRARGKEDGNPQHDASRSTAWSVVSSAEFHRPYLSVVENVPEFMRWTLFPAWRQAMESMGYCLTPTIVDAADQGAPQHRERLFIVMVRAKHPLVLNLQKREHVPASSFVDFNAGNWQPIEKPGRATATLSRIAAGRRVHGDRFISSYYGNEKGGRSLHRPIGTITTRDRHAIVDGDRMRMLSVQEARAAMGFPTDYKLPENKRTAMHMLGNAVVPLVARDIIQEIARVV
ncbi:DNA cytosine methyltransferase [Herminiimonas contaminans]|uniref:DNA (cytosine-5-)-methyltransferase n=1 Tax=Herminiimonas contaminans TaxID=1111140 RepID=A0ABS0ER75_9BURK|nr:DNA cytosine methyltransferase [Herminiimonas contaminans]MBF8177215.1 DNA cytosine methyltransferase [Herminiimonas contaminans]